MGMTGEATAETLFALEQSTNNSKGPGLEDQGTLTAIDPHIIASQLEEGGDVLEHEAERIGLPVVGIIAEEDAALDVCVRPVSMCLDVSLYQKNTACHTEIYMPKKGPVHCGSNQVGRVAGEQHMAAVVALVEG